ncbi:MAG: TRAM domain-containing protein [Planctomycetes bacterium]|nr:TRAM domain-containing protein [Planctomycetota bacterium]
MATDALLGTIIQGEGLVGVLNVVAIVLVIGFCTGAVLLFFVGALSLDSATKEKDITTLSAVAFGLLGGLAIGWLSWLAIQPILNQYLTSMGIHVDGPGSDRGVRILRTVQLLITVLAAYVAISMLLQTKDEFRFIIPYVEFQKQLKGAKPLVLDTSVIIDGRIADICDTGIIDTKLIVPRFVLQELQGIADSSDKIRRNRGRRGLDVLKRMQSNPKIEMQMHEGNLPELRDVQKVDERLVILAKAVSGRVVTNDYNLNKISQLQGVEVINLNELSNALKLVALPGELLSVKIVKQGDQMGQGIGYLDDGTMVVVEQGRQAIGQEVAITVTSVLQTPAGRMIFGRMGGTGDHPVLKT